MKTSELLTEQEIMRCITDGGLNSGQLLAGLERQKSARAAAEQHAALKANSVVGAAHVAKRQTPYGIRIRWSHWLGAKLISAGHRLESSAA